MGTVIEFDWAAELEKTVVHSLVTSFGLDFLLFEDKKGGDVNTIHNVRQNIYATEEEKKNYESRGEYNSNDYHKHERYIQRGRDDKKLQNEGELKDPYRNGATIRQSEARDLDHVISAKEIHNDRGRVLAELNGIELANQDSNLVSTGSSINRSKQDKSVHEFVAYLKQGIQLQEAELLRKEAVLSQMPQETPAQKHEYRKQEDDIRKKKAKLEELKSIDPEKMLETDKQSRKDYDENISAKYYTSSKFIKQTAFAAGSAGFKMGTRQMIGLIMAEFWFELRERVPYIVGRIKSSFRLEHFLHDISETMKGIWERLKSKFSDFLVAFKNGAIGGVLSSVTTTLMNIVVTSQKIVVKLIREMWASLVQAVKVLVFNPEQLGHAELLRAVIKIITTGIATVTGSVIYSELSVVFSFPFGAELAAFIGALTTGIMTLGFLYFLDYSQLMQKVWRFLEKFDHNATLKQFQEINSQLDGYLKELASIELNLDPIELQDFSIRLAETNTEIERGYILRQEIVKRSIDLPFEIGNSSSTRQWLAGVAKK